eukprot:2742165-Amphidinium_carterae.1
MIWLQEPVHTHTTGNQCILALTPKVDGTCLHLFAKSELMRLVVVVLFRQLMFVKYNLWHLPYVGCQFGTLFMSRPMRNDPT